MASFSGPKLSNRIADDVPGIQALLSSLAKLTPDSGNSDYPIGTKRVAETTKGYEFQQYNGTGWVTLEKWNIDAQKVDGYSASTGTTVNTIPVRNANGKLPGDILGNANTANTAVALSATNPVNMGGTGATTAAQARANLVVPPKSHASSSTEYGAGSSTQYGHVKSHDSPDATKTAATGHAFSPAGAVALQEYFASLVGGVEGDISALDTALRALVAQEVEKCLKLTGGTMTGVVRKNGGILVLNSGTTGALYICGGQERDAGSYIMLKPQGHTNNGGELELVAVTKDGEQAALNLRGTGRATIKGLHLVRAVNGKYADESGSLNIDRNANGSMFVTANDVAVMATEGGNSPLTLPDGGQWRYFYVTRDSSGALYSCDTGQKAGGSIIGIPTSGGSGRAIAIRVA